MINSRFLNACYLKPTDKVPVWFMRQAGRALPEYRKIKGSKNIFQLVSDPQVAAQITLLPEKTYDIDALVVFSDITVGYLKAGLNMRLVSNLGPVFDNEFDFDNELKLIKNVTVKSFNELQKTIEIVKSKSNLPLIGFVGGPFTLACYIIERQAKKNWIKTKKFLLTYPEKFDTLLNAIAEMASYLAEAQIKAGCDAIQIFDSWAGVLPQEQFHNFCQKPLNSIVKTTSSLKVPAIYFSLDSFHLMDQIKMLGFNVVSVDSKVSIGKIRDLLGSELAVQGNLDPVTCLCPWNIVEDQTTQILKSNAGRPGFIFNLGHGVLPETNPKILAKLCDFVHEYTIDEKV